MKRVAGGTAVALALVFGLGALVLATELARRHPARFDWTREGRHGLREATLAHLTALGAPIAATLVVAVPAAPENEDERVAAQVAPQLAQLLRAFAKHSRGRFTFEQLDAFAQPARARAALNAFGVRLPNVLLLRSGSAQRVLGVARFAMGDRQGAVRLQGEAALVDALTALTRPPRSVLFTTGHGERSTRDDGPLGLTRAAERLRALGYVVTSTPRLTELTASTALVILADPVRALDAHEVATLDGWLARGGAALVLADAHDDSGPREEKAGEVGLGAALAARGVRLLHGMVHDPKRAMPGGRTTEVRVDAADHEVARALGGAPIVLAGARPLAGGDAVLMTSPDARRANDSRDAPDPRRARHVVAAASVTRGRVLVIGDADFATNARLSHGGHERLWTASVEWLLEGPTRSTAAGADAPSAGRLVLSARAARLSFWLFVLVLPGLAATVGGLLAFARRRRA